MEAICKIVPISATAGVLLRGGLRKLGNFTSPRVTVRVTRRRPGPPAIIRPDAPREPSQRAKPRQPEVCPFAKNPTVRRHASQHLRLESRINRPAISRSLEPRQGRQNIAPDVSPGLTQEIEMSPGRDGTIRGGMWGKREAGFGCGLQVGAGGEIAASSCLSRTPRNDGGGRGAPTGCRRYVGRKKKRPRRLGGAGALMCVCVGLS
jgi:hypothetical protein